MNKAIIAAVLVIAAVGIMFGCTTTDAVPKITNEQAATQAINDVSSDISGISNTLNEINSEFTDTNS